MKAGKGVLLLTCLIAMTTMTGCSQKLAEKDIVLVTDAATLVEGETGKEKGLQEFSHLKLLVIGDTVEEELIHTLLNREEISFQTRVAYCRENIHEKIAGEEESVTDQMRHYRFDHTVTVLELLNTCYSPGTELKVPRIEVKDGRIKEKGTVVFKGGENRVCSQ